MELRLATVDDMDTLIAFRKQLLTDEGGIPCPIDEQLKEFFTTSLTNDTLYQLLMIDDGKAIAAGGFTVSQFPPSFGNPSGVKAYICNMYTVKEYRGQGIATKILDALCIEVKKRGITSSLLYASPQGRPIYLKKGFIDNQAWLDYSDFDHAN